ncbi:hypothetical protein JCM5353_006344 [Sporobolomyces roseus]
MGFSTGSFVGTPPDFTICVICLDVMREATEVCAEAHTLCYQCTSKLKTCPSCRDPIVSKNVRPAKTMQRIIHALPLEKSQKDLSKAQDDLKKAQSELRALKAAEKKRLAAEAAALAVAQRIDDDEVKPLDLAGPADNAAIEDLDGPRPRRSTRPSLRAREARGLGTSKPEVESSATQGAAGRKRGRSESKENEELVRSSPAKAAKLEVELFPELES